ncbi:hypothetical protein [Burkholderia cepacia]|uniref:hypothetical protein n=1 Tax=Burkholderia cepacia TaxID=292 RepID=UPI001CF498C5|nr:hypothetical protein [Burkholderia cepacia]MCA8349176.1 hypothetical protein [Burkholderia cepacia]
MLTLSVKADVRALEKKLDALARKQLPFATAQAINATAEKVREAERENMSKVLDKPNVFIGKVQTKAGVVDGVWQRTKKTRGKAAGLKLMMKFEDAHDVRQHLDYRGVGKRIVAAVFRRELDAAMAKALSTAK